MPPETSNTIAVQKPELIYSPVINYAMQQNYVPVVRRLSIKNNTNEEWRNVVILFTIEPDLAHAWTYSVESVPPDGIIELDAIRISIRPQTLAELTERVSGSLILKVTKNDAVIFEEHHPLDILAYDQWNGIGVLPEMLSAFVTPNHPELPKIIRRASEILQKWTGNPSFDEYQSRNPDRVRKQMAAIYEAIAELQILYCSVPASFEEQGQRVRLADAVLSQKMGNCLDMSLLYAACLEAVGIHPLIVITKGHAFAGGWLIDESFADPVSDDPSLLTKRMAAGINEITLVEATCMNTGTANTFDHAVTAAGKHMLNYEDFGLFIDTKRARFARIRPLPLRIATASGFEIIEEAPEGTRSTDAPLALGETLIVAEGKGGPTGKQQLWERKLLDLTLRNNLLNLRVTKGTLQFISINPAKFEDALASGQEFQILPKPADWDNPYRSAGLYQTVHTSDPILDLVQHELSQKRLRSYLSEAELTANLTNLYRSSRLALEENGANTLYIALGFLKWYETAASEVARYAPLLLLPVEIVRKSARQGFVIRSREEEAMLNITLLEKMRQDYGIEITGLETLPRDQSGLDVPTIFNIIRRAVMAKSRWDIEEQVVLGTFSFSKFILWNDIHNNSHHLLQSKVVASLVSGKLEWPVEHEPSRDLDAAFNPTSIALPIATDSSQLEAIISSGEGKSFVLHGPPGTGKSQTITNIIANALFAGKKVLFVAAKKAALDVVESRLESIGIGPFCLELHSNKAKKTAVIEQLKQASEATKRIAPTTFESEANRLSLLRGDLNEYVKLLHHRWSFGLSLYEAFSRYSLLEGEKEKFSFSATTIASLTSTQLAEWNDMVSELQILAGSVGNVAHHPLRGIEATQYTPQLKSDLATALKDYLNALRKAESAITKAASLIKVDPHSSSKKQTELFATFVKAILELPNIPTSMLAVSTPDAVFSHVKEVAKHGRKRDEIKATLQKTFSEGVLRIDASALLTEWNAVSNRWLLPRWLGQKKVAKALNAFSAGSAIDKGNVADSLQGIIEFQKENDIVSKATDVKSVSGVLWGEENCDWNALEHACDSLSSLFSLAVSVLGPAALSDWRQQFALSAGDNTAMFLSAHQNELNAFLKSIEKVTTTEEELQKIAGKRRESNIDSTGTWITGAANTAERQLSGLDLLKDWLAWSVASKKGQNIGLGELIKAFDSEVITSAEIDAQYRKALYRSCAEYILSQSPQLSAFNSSVFEEKISRFKSMSSTFERLTKEELYARLGARIPDFSTEASQSSEVGILQKAIRSNGRAMTIRKLFDSIPNLLPRLTPCMLMSPISVAQYFDASSTKFDLVIFDEASQMPTCEAIGAMARGANVIVVGDPKQMPPSSFFASANKDEEDMEEDLESILDDCLALSMPSKHLLWHYRSKHESLIAFSNAKYYDNKLLTFPSTDDIATKVTCVHVPGYYDKGRTRQNRAEATAIVAEIMRRLADPVLSKRSIGVVTFSSVQQNLIDDLLIEEFGKAPHLEKVALESEEPLFIKNLENVQGDERDVILFSICYGPDENNKISLNFGPLNREGGWRRLNVAVSRARFEMKVFATLRADQIDLARTASEGVAGLKAFLTFAEKGKSALPIKAGQSLKVPVGLETRVAEAIRAKGYEVHLSIGCSGYRVDLGVVNPEKPSEYLLGVLLDGPNYSSAQTARDREVVQSSVLGSLGWNLHRIWSPDWWENSDKVMVGVVNAIENTKNVVTLSSLTLKAEVHKEDTPPTSQNSGVLNSIAAPVAPSVPTSNAMTYDICILTRVSISSDAFLQDSSLKLIRQQIEQVLDVEAPISRNLLFSRVLAAWGIGRAGTRIAAHLDRITNGMNLRHTKHGSQLFFWTSLQTPATYNEYRLAGSESQKRDADDLPAEEIANGIKDILKRQLSLPKSDLIRETAKQFGYARMGSKVEAAMLLGIDEAIKRGVIISDGDRMVYGER